MSHKKSNEYVGYHGPGTGGGDSNELVNLQTLSTQRQDRQDVRVPADHLIGDQGKAFEMAQRRLSAGRMHHAIAPSPSPSASSR